MKRRRLSELKRVLLVLLPFCMAFGVAYFADTILLYWQESRETMADQVSIIEEKTSQESIFLEEQKRKGDKKEEKNAYLTFDDGPSEHTDKILDILKEKGVKATFFVVGKEGKAARKRYKRILEEGHSMGMHSYSHDYSYIYSSLEHYKEDILKLQDYLYEVTGQKVKLYRFPGGSSNSVSKIPIKDCISFLREEDIVYFDWNASSEDAVTANADCSELNSNILQDALRFHNAVILMHDLSACKGTVEGLSKLIDRLEAEGYEIKPITEDTTPVQHVK